MAETPQEPSHVYVIPIAGDVEPSMAAFLKRALDGVPDSPENLIIIEMDTFGGRLDSAFEMVETLSNVKSAKTIAYVTNKAISAGALISLACNRLIMKQHTTIGDCAPITVTQEGPQIVGEKVQSPLRAKFRALAKKNGYPVVLAESMVSMEMEVYQIEFDGEAVFMDAQEYKDLSEERKAQITSKKTIVAEGELLTMDDAEAHDLGFSSMSVEGLDDLLSKLKIAGKPLTRIQPSWSEGLVGLIGKISPILMLIGLGALYTEIKAPGFGAPGIIGILCLGLVFFNQYLVGLANYTELLIIIIGLILMGFEIFVIPGFGITGIAGLLIIAIGLILSFQDFVIPDPQLPWEKALLFKNASMVIGAACGAIIMAVVILRFVFPRLSRSAHGPYLSTTLSEVKVGWPENTPAEAGQTGIALTQLRPSGKAEINGEPYDVVTQGDFIPRGSKIKVLNVKHNKITVVELDISNE